MLITCFWNCEKVCNNHNKKSKSKFKTSTWKTTYLHSLHHCSIWILYRFAFSVHVICSRVQNVLCYHCTLSYSDSILCCMLLFHHMMIYIYKKNNTDSCTSFEKIILHKNSTKYTLIDNRKYINNSSQNNDLSCISYQIRHSVPQPIFQSLVITLINPQLDYKWFQCIYLCNCCFRGFVVFGRCHRKGLLLWGNWKCSTRKHDMVRNGKHGTQRCGKQMQQWKCGRDS